MDFEITDEIVSAVATVHAVCTQIGRRDRDLANQIQRAMTSVGLNAAEGLYARGGHRTLRLESAMNSGREAVMGLRIAGATGYIEQKQAASTADSVDRIVAILYKLTYRRSS